MLQIIRYSSHVVTLRKPFRVFYLLSIFFLMITNGTSIYQQFCIISILQNVFFPYNVGDELFKCDPENIGFNRWVTSKSKPTIGLCVSQELNKAFLTEGYKNSFTNSAIKVVPCRLKNVRCKANAGRYFDWKKGNFIIFHFIEFCHQHLLFSIVPASADALLL